MFIYQAQYLDYMVVSPLINRHVQQMNSIGASNYHMI